MYLGHILAPTDSDRYGRESVMLGAWIPFQGSVILVKVHDCIMPAFNLLDSASKNGSPQSISGGHRCHNFDQINTGMVYS